ncbi:phage portal protein (plasmid) [Streptomyces sp. NBC_01278]|uniref:phage portal protein n=1 Tax=Streptomyces sp. NBC_01278 TaxID=2903809 RepID=UPI002E32B0FC|nr:phage portal protein [Streptomyces sp. NBC_01278]
MAGRRFLPNLRSLFAGGTPPPETKTISWSGGAYSSTSYAGTSNIWGTEGRADGWDMDRVVTEGYERVVWVFKAIDTIGKHASRLPLELGAGLTEEGEFEETFPDHPLLRVLNGQANPLETGAMLRKRLSAQVLLSKRGAFVEKTRSRAGTITRLDLLPPDRVLPIPDPKGDYLSHFEFTTREGVIRELDPERVVWIRDPHPTDPFSGVTPLEAAGISVDLDHLSRLYNVTFIRNDARPGGVIAVDASSLSPQEMDRLESRFLPGSDYAGHLSVIGTGPGGMAYVDTAAKPRDMNYEHASQNAKLEILAAFGVPESVTGNASGRTFDNAEQEELGFWLHTELGHLELIANAFEKDAGDGMRLRYDTSTVEVLELPRRRRRAEAREEWNAGLISIDEYRKLAGLPSYANPHTRALWISPQKAPVPLVPEDAAALGIAGGPGQTAAGTAAPGPNAPLQPGAPAIEGAAAQAVAEAHGESGADVPVGGPAAAAIAEARGSLPAPGPGAAAAAVEEAHASGGGIPEEGQAAAAVAAAHGVQTKALNTGSGFNVDDGDFDNARSAVEAALNALFARQEGVIAARLRSPKARKGTRFWLDDGPSDTRGGNSPLDIARAVSAEKWREEIIETLVPVLNRIAQSTAKDAADALGGPLLGASAGTGAAVLSAASVAAETIRVFHDYLVGALDAEQIAGGDLDQLVAELSRILQEEAPEIIERVAESAAIATVNGAADAVAAATGPMVLRTWHTRQDDRVRPAHEAAEGTTLPVNTPFQMEGWPVRFPGDPLAPLSLTRNCRCRLYYRTDIPGSALLSRTPTPEEMSS